ncbi:MAG TPA: DUF2585 family protein [Geminicoccaceae bacterium]
MRASDVAGAADAARPGMPDARLLHLCIAGLIVLFAAGTLLAMGREPWCTCGTVRLWYGNVHGPENSQQIADWYTPSHVIHGFLFYGALSLCGRVTGRPLPLTLRFALAIGIEAAWEIAENTPAVIAHYRAATMAAGYTGDSVLNSMSDIAAMAAGFWLAHRLPAVVVVALALAMEAGVAYAVRDNLTLNVLMLLHDFPAIRAWQTAA